MVIQKDPPNLRGMVKVGYNRYYHKKLEWWYYVDKNGVVKRLPSTASKSMLKEEQQRMAAALRDLSSGSGALIRAVYYSAQRWSGDHDAQIVSIRERTKQIELEIKATYIRRRDVLLQFHDIYNPKDTEAMKPSELARRRSSHICVHGDPKTGKSTIVSKLLEAGFRLTWVSMDNGHEVIFKVKLTPEQLDEQLNIIVIPDTKESPIAVKTCARIMSGKPASICDTHGIADCSACRAAKKPFTTVDTSTFGPKDILVFDHLGQLANSTMNLIMIKAKDEDKPEWEDYRVQGTLMDKFLVNIQQANFNVICITHSVETDMEDGKKRLVPQIGSDKFSRNGGKYFDHIVHTDVTNGKHRYGSATTYKPTVLTGSRGDILIHEDGSLVPFFDGTIPPQPAENVEAATKLLATINKPKEVDSDALVSINTEAVEQSDDTGRTTTENLPGETKEADSGVVPGTGQQLQSVSKEALNGSGGTGDTKQAGPSTGTNGAATSSQAVGGSSSISSTVGPKAPSSSALELLAKLRGARK